MMSEYITVSYLIEAKNLHKKAESIAVGMTVGSWTDLPLARQELLAPYLGTTGNVTIMEERNGLQKGIISIRYPVGNITPDIPALLTTVFGKLSMDGKIKLLDIDFPPSLLKQFPGPKFGIAGVRELLGVHDRPLLMSIFKSCLGLPLGELETQFAAQVEGGVDLVKDDEIFFVDDKAPLANRLTAYNRIIEASGRTVLYAANLTGPVHQLVDKAKYAIEKGANCLLLNVLPYGFDILHRLAADPDINVPLMAHPAMAGAFYASDEYGIASPLLLGKLMRLAGADMILYPSPYGSVALKQSEALAIAEHVRISNDVHKSSFPVPSAGIHPGLVGKLYDDFGMDVIVNAGGGIHGHPGGAADGARAFRAAINTVVQGKTLAEGAKVSRPLAIALEKWGGA
ncbi:2,3-diketo-5-methylthiopentyl-1-phosphate enolase [Aneurinibacillus thermoaerophilus]|uniref:2,3-diketo-5-methylthiopentyl-1-phosphate enolase n=1 Tax=Aneurinibacillus thermoaerophilus TaxID=143495 RepID=UPI002E225471|nr:2,3-diketo-5-methylthiopentyl-1-phosphate enolase [Aneurinibacillus thermoaerophilus]